LKRVAVLQSNYVPWKGYFDLIASVDEFVFYDDMQYTRRDWRNRNRIKTPTGLQWLTVPVLTKGHFEQSIRDTRIDGDAWAQTHWKALMLNYRRAPAFAATAAWLEPLLRQSWGHLSVLNRALIEAVCARLGIATRLRCSWDYPSQGGRSERLASICAQAGATVYLSGPSARDYLDEAAFSRRGITVEWFDYAGYLSYPQLWGAFEPAVSILDLLFNCGADAPRYALRAHRTSH
jgi:hypothetical protein